MRQRAGSARTLTPTRWETGRRAESAVADLLFAGGFTLLARNVRLGALEIDLLARKGGLLVIVEVRSRGARSWQRPLESIGATKRRRLRQAAAVLWKTHKAWLHGINRVRIDAAAVTFEAHRTSVEYVTGAVG